MNRLPLYILAGGRSERFGSDKARAKLEGQPLIRRIADALAPAAEPTRVLADRAGKYADLGLITLADRRPGLGPLAGLETALLDRLHHHGDGWLILCSCDLLEMRPHWIQRLHSAHGGEDDEVRAVVFVEPEGGPQPLLALYHTGLLPRVQEHLEADQRGMRRFLRTLGPAVVQLPTPPDWPDRIQANRPEELTELRRTTRSDAPEPPRSNDRTERNR